MRKNPFSKFAGACALVALVAAAAPVQAGQREDYSVQFDLANSSVKGALGSVFNDATSDFIMCKLASNVVTCWASSSVAYRTCSTSNAAIVNTFQGITSQSVLSFKWNSSGACTYLEVWNGSQYRPKSHL